VDRELVLAVLALLVFGGLTPLSSLLALAWRSETDLSAAGALLERRAAWRLVAPIIPGLLGLSGVIGWALVEPESAERPPALALVACLPVLVVCLRAGVRAVAALRQPLVRTAATLGLFRPRVVIAPDFAESLDAGERDAVLEHERAHARHFDPLRVWLAQILTDLQWPLPGAPARFAAWRATLEFARDDEARAIADADALASAVLRAARRGSALAVVGVSSTASAVLRARVERLMAPSPAPPTGARLPLASALAALAGAALAAGACFGEALVLALFG
jgi:beta-lactamase regulating signal transducer with metallopeptidase domain